MPELIFRTQNYTLNNSDTWTISREWTKDLMTKLSNKLKPFIFCKDIQNETMVQSLTEWVSRMLKFWSLFGRTQKADASRQGHMSHKSVKTKCGQRTLWVIVCSMELVIWDNHILD